jgi:hypothetical protein
MKESIIQVKENTYRSQLMFNRWVSLNSDVASEFKAITDFDFHKPDNELLDRLQSYLRFTLYHYQLTELKRACSHQNSANNYPLLNANSNFTNFAALYYNIPENVNPIYNEFARSEIIKAAIDSVRHLVKNNFESETFVPLFIEMLYGNVDKKTITEETLPSETSPILEALLQITANFEWANHLNLDYLSRAFKVNFHILDNGAPRWKFKDAEGMHTIELNNENNSHWTTQVMFAKAFDSTPTKAAPQKQVAPSQVAPSTVATTIIPTPPTTTITPTMLTTTLPADAQASKATLLSTSPASTSKPEEVSPKIKKVAEPLPKKDQEKLERLRQQIANATVGYLEYNNSIWFSIFHRHGKRGRIRAQNFNTSFAAINNYDDAKATLISFLKDPQLGNTHPHSFRTMLLNELENNKSGNLQQTSKYFNDKLGKLASELNISLLSLPHKG